LGGYRRYELVSIVAGCPRYLRWIVIRGRTIRDSGRSGPEMSGNLAEVGVV
jgi:hypothetical protein